MLKRKPNSAYVPTAYYARKVEITKLLTEINRDWLTKSEKVLLTEIETGFELWREFFDSLLLKNLDHDTVDYKDAFVRLDNMIDQLKKLKKDTNDPKRQTYIYTLPPFSEDPKSSESIRSKRGGKKKNPNPDIVAHDIIRQTKSVTNPIISPLII